MDNLYLIQQPTLDLEKEVFLKLLECPVCMTIPLPPIGMCENGHNICSECQTKSLLCPQCQGCFTEARNFIAEQLLEQFNIKCTYSKLGCTLMVNIKDWDCHLNNCDFRPVVCNMKETKPCINVNISYTKYVKHLKKIHKFSGVLGNTLNIIQHADHDRVGLVFPVPLELWPAHYLEAYDRTFLVGTEIQPGKIFWWIYLVGSKEDARKFLVKITITKHIAELKMSWTGPVQSFRLSPNEVKENGECLLALKSNFSPFTYLENSSEESRMSWNLSFTISQGTMGEFGMGRRTPPTPHSAHQQKSVLGVREKVELHKTVSPWKPAFLRSRTQDVKYKGEDKILNEIIGKTRGILNKLTPDTFDRLAIEFLELNLEDKDNRIAAVVFVLFEKAINEPIFSTAYANMAKVLCDKSQLSAKPFRKNILDQCQMVFQMGSSADEEVRVLEEELATAKEERKDELKLKLTDKKYALRNRRLGNIRFIGELYKLNMFTPRIMMDLIAVLLQNDDEESYETLCKLLSTIGQRLDKQLKELELRAQAASLYPQRPVKFIPPEKYMDNTFAKLQTLSIDQRLSSRIRFLLLDMVELRELSWKPRREPINNW